MSVSIKVAVRCRPFTIDDRLGVKMKQISEEEGEIELINCDYSTKRFPFTYTWWSAYGYKRHVKEDLDEADNMELIDQNAVYTGCGQKIKNDLLTGNAVVLFAYGLSGSGKTFTVFGPDAADAPEAWFKHSEPHPLWGIFPRLAYEIFNEKQDGWKITMKYFQNVVDIVRDLMSSSGEEQHYKNGMRKDPDGFMDIEWCSSKVINSWNDLRQQFQIANSRKAIAPTQFNPMSTRGHCIMVLEVEMPHPDNSEMKQRGRVYVCDLAGTEPAGDIVYAQYTKIQFDNNEFEYKFTGPHPDQKKTKELQDQGKKINLSLSEMAQFFMKMAEAVMKKKLTPGMSIPGCNSFFLCKYLKDTMLQARTYLFCAIRPEVEYLKYTFATLGFAKNASVVKLAPKKATVSASAAERRLMAELEAMKELVAKLQAQNTNVPANPSSQVTTNQSSEESDRIINELQLKLSEKQNLLQNQLVNEDSQSDNREKLEYQKRGIELVAYIDINTIEDPYLINLDEDAFRSNRFLYIINKDVTTIGNKTNDIQPISLSIVKDHCTIKYNKQSNELTIIGGKGDTWLNGEPVIENKVYNIYLYDRLAIGDQLLLLYWNKFITQISSPKKDGNVDNKEARVKNQSTRVLSAEEAVEEYHNGIMKHRNNNQSSQSGGDNYNYNEEKQKLLEEKEKWKLEKQEIISKRNEEEYQRAMLAIDNIILDLLPKTKEIKLIVDLLNRITLSFDVILEKGSNSNSNDIASQIPKVKIIVENSYPKYSILIDPPDFLSKLSLLKDEIMKMRSAIESNREYVLPIQHDPMYLMFDNDFLLGSAIQFPEYLLYNFETDEDEKNIEIKNTAVPYNTIGLLEVRWHPLGGPNEDDENKPIRDIDSEDDLLGKPWTYRVEIKRAMDLPIFCELAYVQYDFFGETFVTEAVQQQTYSPTFDYTKVHHVPTVTKEFLEYLKGSVEFQIHVSQHIDEPPDKIGTINQIVVDSIKSGEPKGYEVQGTLKPKTEIELRCEYLTKELLKSQDENKMLKQKIEELEMKLSNQGGSNSKANSPNSKSFNNSKINKTIDSAKLIDTIVNGVS